MPSRRLANSESTSNDRTQRWSEILSAHAGWIYAVIRSRLGDAALADDAFQNVALAAGREGGLPSDATFDRPWLYRVAIRQCLLIRRRLGRERRFHQQCRSSARREVEEPLAGMLVQERQAAIRAALADLPEIDRDVLLLKYLEDWTYRDLADHLGVTVHTIEYRLLRARRRLRAALLRHGLEATADSRSRGDAEGSREGNPPTGKSAEQVDDDPVESSLMEER